ncbi:hypothetical protein SNEBB_008149 [Seison nebaliae]|nr:hypothetical protein SNEBB_008149 [Seison nebaliae]
MYISILLLFVTLSNIRASSNHTVDGKGRILGNLLCPNFCSSDTHLMWPTKRIRIRSNGCGPLCGGAITRSVLDFYGLVPFEKCCDEHDICYSSCQDGDTKEFCDNEFFNCMYNFCHVVSGFKRLTCESFKLVMYHAVDDLGYGLEYHRQRRSIATHFCPSYCRGDTVMKYPDSYNHSRKISNGCGPNLGRTMNDYLINRNLSHLIMCCSDHDYCYTSCNALTSKSHCDNKFLECLEDMCVFLDRTIKDDKTTNHCRTAASVMHYSVDHFGCFAYLTAKKTSKCQCY